MVIPTAEILNRMSQAVPLYRVPVGHYRIHEVFGLLVVDIGNNILVEMPTCYSGRLSKHVNFKILEDRTIYFYDNNKDTKYTLFNIIHEGDLLPLFTLFD